MRDALLFGLTGLLPLAFIALLAERIYRKRHPDVITITEWRERLKALDEVTPIPLPRYKSKFVSTGAAGVTRPMPKSKRKLSVVKQKSGTR